MGNITIEDAAGIIDATVIPTVSAQPAIDRGLVEGPSIEARHDLQADEIEISVTGADWDVDSVFIEVCDGLVDSDDVSGAIEEVLSSFQDADSPRVPLEDLTEIAMADGPRAPAGSACLTDLAQSLRDRIVTERLMRFYVNDDHVDVVVERSHGCYQCREWHHLSGPIHTASMKTRSQERGCGSWLGPSYRTVELDIEDGTVSADSVDDVIDALTEAVVEVLAEDVDRIERAAPRWAAEHDDADWEDHIAYNGIETYLDEAIIDGVREAGYQAVIDSLVHYEICGSVDEAREHVLSALSEAVTNAA